jgi:hypothetical protein
MARDLLKTSCLHSPECFGRQAAEVVPGWRGRAVTNSGTDRSGWYKSSHSGGSGCVEVLITEQFVAVRDSKAPSAGELTFTPREWQAFLEGVQDGQFDLPERRSA